MAFAWSSGAGVFPGIDDRQGLLAVCDVLSPPCRSPVPGPRSRAGLVVFRAGRRPRPSAQPKARTGDDLLVFGCEQRAGLGSRRLPGPRSCGRSCRSRDRPLIRSFDPLIAMSRVPALAQRQAGLVEEAHEAQDRPGPGSRDRSGGGARPRDRLKSVSPALIACGGTLWIAHKVRAMASLDVAVLDVVVDEPRNCGRSSTVVLFLQCSAGACWCRRGVREQGSSGRIRSPPDAPDPSSARR